MTTLRVGDVCEIVQDLDRIGGRNMTGLECTITGPLAIRFGLFRGGRWSEEERFLIRVAGGNLALAHPTELRLKRPPLGRWEQCLWQPKREIA